MTIPDEAVQAFKSEFHTKLGIGYDENIRRALTAALPFLHGVKVKALKWSGEPPYHVARVGTKGFYCIEAIWNEKGFVHVELTGSFGSGKTFATVDEAKAAAQADYAARILSAIEPAPSPRAQALEEGGFRKEYAALGRTLNSLALNANDEDMKPAVAELSRRIFRTLLGANPSPLGSVEDITSSADNRYGLEVAAKWHETEAAYYEGRHGDKDGVPFPIVAGWHRLHSERIRALSSQPVADGLPQDVINLVIAAREACDSWQLAECEYKKLDHALDAFSERIPYENEPDAIPTSPGASE